MPLLRENGEIMFKNRFCCLMVFIVVFVLCTGILFPGMSRADAFKVLVVMSYDEEFGWGKEIREGIRTVLSDQCAITYFQLDTLKNMAGGKEKAKQAYELYQELQPNGVIASDDNAQTLFVIPYLRDKVSTPVIFCGVNADPEQYGYPSSNVTGILERVHFRESILFLQQLVPCVRTVGYMMKDSSTAEAFFRQARKESDSYPAKSVDFKRPKTLKEAIAMATELRPLCDALFMEVMDGLLDENGDPLSESDIIPAVTKAFGKPTFCANKYTAENGVLCAVVKTGQEQGETAARMLLKAMQGTPISQIPVTRNHHGKAILNVTVMKSLGIRPCPMALQKVEVVKAKE